MKYPKFFLFFITIIIAYTIFSNQDSELIQSILSSLGYLGAFISGVLYSYSFSTTIATSILLILGKQNILLTGLIGGLGSLFGDSLIYKFIKHSFDDELEKLSKEKIIVKINKSLNKHIKHYILPVLAAFVIASPLPDEIGVALLVASRKIVPEKYSYLFFYILNTIGIFIILIIGHNL